MTFLVKIDSKQKTTYLYSRGQVVYIEHLMILVNRHTLLKSCHNNN
jgi:hypothetical protein